MRPDSLTRNEQECCPIYFPAAAREEQGGSIPRRALVRARTSVLVFKIVEIVCDALRQMLQVVAVSGQPLLENRIVILPYHPK